AHDEPVTLSIKWTTRQSGIAFPSAHRLDQIECAERQRREWRFRSAGDHDVREIIADVTQCFAHRHRSARATVRVRGADAAKSKFDRDVRMRRAAENLQRERGIHSARSFFQKSNVLIFRLANSAERGAETHADSMLRIFASIL